ncbi:MAG: cysteine hydrolase family protein [Candidatus Limnocylindrales bacterium]
MPEPYAIDLDTVLNRKYPGLTHVDPRKSALLVVDMQGYFLHPDQPAYLPGGNGAPSSETVLENGARCVDLCRSKGIPVIWSRWGLRGDGWDVGRWAPKWPAWHAGTAQGPAWENPEVEIAAPLKPLPGEPVFDKSRYSSFWGTPLQTFLQHLPGVDTLIIIGVTTNFCVRYTVEDAFSLDYHVLVIADCTTATNDPIQYAVGGSGQYIAALKDFQIGLGDVWTLAELEKDLSS